MINGTAIFLGLDENGKTKPITVQTNGNINTTVSSIPTNTFNGFLSGNIIAMGRTDTGKLVPILIESNGGF